MAYNTLVLQVVHDLFHEAALQFVKTNGNIGKFEKKRSEEAFTLIRGSGLDHMIEYYDLGLDPNMLRTSFYRRFHINA